jgi:hypothetical protein
MDKMLRLYREVAGLYRALAKVFVEMTENTRTASPADASSKQSALEAQFKEQSDRLKEVRKEISEMAMDSTLPDYTSIGPSHSVPESEHKIDQSESEISYGGSELSEATGYGLGRSAYVEAEGSADITKDIARYARYRRRPPRSADTPQTDDAFPKGDEAPAGKKSPEVGD